MNHQIPTADLPAELGEIARSVLVELPAGFVWANAAPADRDQIMLTVAEMLGWSRRFGHAAVVGAERLLQAVKGNVLLSAIPAVLENLRLRQEADDLLRDHGATAADALEAAEQDDRKAREALEKAQAKADAAAAKLAAAKLLSARVARAGELFDGPADPVHVAAWNSWKANA